jgi:predicted aspartyl protease
MLARTFKVLVGFWLGVGLGALRLEAAGPEGGAGVPFELREGLIWLRVRAAQSAEPLNFLLDSGAEASVLNLSTARRLGLKLGAKVKVQGVGASAGGYWPEHLQAQAGNISLPTEYLAVDLKCFSDACGCRVDGLIGADFFRGRRVQIDFKERRVRLLTATEVESQAEAVPIRVRPHAMEVSVRINDEPAQWLRLDTGCATSLQWVKAKLAGVEGPEVSASSLGKIFARSARSSVQLGGTRWRDVPTAVHSEAMFPGESGLLGNGLLSRFARVTIDAKAGRILLAKAEEYGE